MSKKKPPRPRLIELLNIVPERIRPPVAIIMGGSRDVVDFVAARGKADEVCYQMDLYPAQQLEKEVAELGVSPQIAIKPDLWDLEGPFQTILYPVPERGERELKIDLTDQAFHILAERGSLIVLTANPHDQLFPPLLKKMYGKVHVPAAGNRFVSWCQREGDRPRRRHEVAFQISQPEKPSLRFLSRPGVFSYGRFDNGARALTEVMAIKPGAKILDLGCGCGTNGIIAGLRGGPDSRVVFVDSNVRALALTEINARHNGLTNFQTIATTQVENIAAGAFDVILANPPYFAKNYIALSFIEGARRLLRGDGQFYLVTKQPQEMSEMFADTFEKTEVVFQRGYAVFTATC